MQYNMNYCRHGKDQDDVCVTKMTNELATMKPMIPPGVKPIKQVELGTKWRRLVPEEYRDDVYPIPSIEIMEKFKKTRKQKISRNN